MFKKNSKAERPTSLKDVGLPKGQGCNGSFATALKWGCVLLAGGGLAVGAVLVRSLFSSQEELLVMESPFMQEDSVVESKASARLASSMLKRGAERYKELIKVLESVQDAESAANAEKPAATLLQEIAAINTLLRQCRLNRQAVQGLESDTKAFMQALGKYNEARVRILSASPVAYGCEPLEQLLDATKEYVYGAPEDIEALMVETADYLKEKDRELKRFVVTEPKLYTQAMDEFVARCNGKDEALDDLAIRWAKIFNGNTSHVKVDNQVWQEIESNMLYIYLSWLYGEATKCILYLQCDRSGIKNHAGYKDWLDTCSRLLPPMQCALATKNSPSTTFEYDLMRLILLHDELIAACEKLKEEDSAEVLPEEIRLLYSEILYRRMGVQHVTVREAPDASCLYRLLLTRMKELAAVEDKGYYDVHLICSDTERTLKTYGKEWIENINVYKEEKPIIDPKPLMMRVLLAEQLCCEQRAQEALCSVSDKKSAVEAMALSAETLRRRKTCSMLIKCLGVKEDEKPEELLSTEDDIANWTESLDYKLSHFLAEECEKYGLPAACDSEVPAVTVVELNTLLTDTYSLLHRMTQEIRRMVLPEATKFHAKFFPELANLAMRWGLLELQHQPLTPQQLEMYDARMNQLTEASSTFIAQCQKVGMYSDTIETCALMLPPIRKAISDSLSGADDPRPLQLAVAKLTAKDLPDLLKQIKDEETARKVLPELQEAATGFSTVQESYLQLFSSIDALMWPQVLELRAIYCEFNQQAEDLEASEYYGCEELEPVIKGILDNWIPNLAEKR